MQNIETLFDYFILITDHPEHETDLNMIFDILHEVLNSTKPTIRINGENKPKAVVAGKLLKLTSLYHAREQSYLDLMNLGHRNRDF